MLIFVFRLPSSQTKQFDLKPLRMTGYHTSFSFRMIVRPSSGSFKLFFERFFAWKRVAESTGHPILLKMKIEVSR
ncbi:hypothetical protein CH370_06645 [Leptospira kmetyi]|nr:hypothetical protein CH370_06645 [Leptospira kmetyi]